MAILFPSPGRGWLLTFKVLLASAAVLLTAAMMKTSVPVIQEFVVSEVPSVYAFVLSWLRPPYLYVLINCIIISIVASSKLQHHGAEEAPPPGAPAGKESGDARVEYASYDIAYVEESTNTISDPEYVLVGAEDAKVKEVMTDGQVELLGPVKLPEIVNDDISFLNTNEDEKTTKKKKPPTPGKFPPRRQTKSSPEPGKALGVSKPKRHDTLESTWKAITDGRPMPLARHLRKSDTWGDRLRRNDENIPPPPPAKMKKSETFTTTDHSGSNPPPLIRSPGGSGKIKREPSLGQDELNRRVEAFIKKFNEEMRLQRQESLNQQYQEMIRQAAA